MGRFSLEEIGEGVKVLASFNATKLVVHFFSWRGRTYRVESMNLFHVEKDADRQIYNFAVSSGGNTYQLTFDPVSLDWQLRDVLAG